MKEKGWEVTNEGAVKIPRRRRWSNNNPNTQQQKRRGWSTVHRRRPTLSPPSGFPTSSRAGPLCPTPGLQHCISLLDVTFPNHPQRSHVRPEPKPSACPAPRTKVSGKQDTKVGGRDLLPFPPIKVANKHFMVSLNVLSF